MVRVVRGLDDVYPSVNDRYTDKDGFEEKKLALKSACNNCKNVKR